MDKYYSILGVQPSASFEEISKAYKKRLKIVHPDRFDAKTQAEEWGQANKMLQELNEAYDWFKKNHTTGNQDYNEKRTNNGDGYQKARTEKQHTTGETSGNQSSSYQREKPSLKGITRTPIHTLSNTHIHFIRSLRADNKNIKILTPNIYIKSLAFIFCVVIAISIFYSIVNSDSMVESDFAVGLIMTLIATAFGSHYGIIVSKYLKSKIKPCVLFTPMYFIRIDFDEIVFGYEWEIDSVKFHREQMGLPYINFRLQRLFQHFSGATLGLRIF